MWASDELIGSGTDWLLLREGGNFSVILWLIIALKYVTVPTPSEVFWQEALMCVHTSRQTDSQLCSTHSMGSNTSAFDSVFCRCLRVVNCHKIRRCCRWIKSLKSDGTSAALTACLLETVTVFYTSAAVAIENWTDSRRERLACKFNAEIWKEILQTKIK